LQDLAAYAPGKTSIAYPEGIAQKFSSNDRLVMQTHFGDLVKLWMSPLPLIAKDPIAEIS